MKYTQGLYNQKTIEANINGKPINVNYAIINETGYGCAKLPRNVIENILSQFDIEKAIENFGYNVLMINPKQEDAEEILHREVKSLKESIQNEDEDFAFFGRRVCELFLITKISEMNFDGEFDFDTSLLKAKFTFFFKDKEEYQRFEDALSDIFYSNEMNQKSEYNTFEIKLEFEKENIKLQKYFHKDLLGNEILIGDIGVGCDGRGIKVFGLDTYQITSTGKTFINGNINPKNFLVLKPIDGRQLKGV